MMNFSEALSILKEGKRIKRKGWNGQDQYLTLATAEYYIDCDGTKHFTNVPCIVFHGTKGIQVGWLASQEDMLSYDWVVKED